MVVDIALYLEREERKGGHVQKRSKTVERRKSTADTNI